MVNVAKSLLVPIKEKKKVNNNIFYDQDKKFIFEMRRRYNSFRRNPDADISHIKYWTNIPPSSNVPIICANKEDMYEKIKKACRTMSGHSNFVLGMLTDDGVYQVWERPSQPCQGGEMRKYGCTHDDCTRPDDPRPGDLYYPFPDGKPLAVGARVAFSDNLVPVYLSLSSPYRRAYGHSDNVELVKDGSGNIQGLFMKDADLVDPTMFVTLIKALRNVASKLHQADVEFLKVATPSEYLMLKRYGGIPSHWSPSQYDNGDEYYEGSSTYLDLKAYFKGGIEASQDLTGGSLGQRYDYNRPQLMEVFINPDQSKNFSIKTLLSKAKFHTAKNAYDFLPQFREAINEVL